MGKIVAGLSGELFVMRGIHHEGNPFVHKEDEKKKKRKKKYGSKKKRVHRWYVNGKTRMAIQPTSLSPILDVSVTC